MTIKRIKIDNSVNYIAEDESITNENHKYANGNDKNYLPDIDKVSWRVAAREFKVVSWWYYRKQRFATRTFF